MATVLDQESGKRTQAKKERERLRKTAAERQAAGRDIGPIREIANVRRRESCRFDLAKFCKTYSAKTFYLEWSQFHLDAIARLEEAVLQGAMYAFAMPRGSGKSSLSKLAAMWAVSYAHCRYVFLIGATGPKAEKLLASIKMRMRFGKEYVEDFPEITQGVVELKGKGNAASGQLCERESTLIEWSKQEIVLPTVPAPPNFKWPKGTKKADKVYAPTSGSVIGVSGLMGEGIRGSVRTTVDGEEIRPDLVLPDDPQTDESAGSEKQNQDRYELMTGAVLGMAGPDKNISLIMPCTKIKNGDMVTAVLDRKRNPLFRGTTTAMLSEMPTNLEAWEPYFEKYQSGACMEPPSFDEANQYYLDHRDEMDAGAEPSWPDRFKEGEVSAIQHAMNLYCRDPKTFYAEYQNDPQGDSDDVVFLTADEIVKKQNPYKRYEVPLEVTKITAFIDVQGELLFYAIVGWSNDFSGFILDYGTYPKQERIHFYKNSLPVTLSQKYGNRTEGGRIKQALHELAEMMGELRLKRSDDVVMKIDRIGVDSAWNKVHVLKFIREVKDDRYTATFGGKWTGTEKPMNHPDNIKKWTTGGRRLGPNWRLGDAESGVQRVEVNPNAWKTFVSERMATPYGEPESLSLFKQEQFRHSLFASHFSSEFREKIETRYGKFDVWKLKPGRPDNDWLDCISNCAVMASFESVESDALSSEETGVKRKKLDGSKWGKPKQ